MGFTLIEHGSNNLFLFISELFVEWDVPRVPFER